MDSRIYLKILNHCEIGQNMPSKCATMSNVHFYENMCIIAIEGLSSLIACCRALRGHNQLLVSLVCLCSLGRINKYKCTVADIENKSSGAEVVQYSS